MEISIYIKKSEEELGKPTFDNIESLFTPLKENISFV
jgi:hypothetical protein